MTRISKATVLLPAILGVLLAQPRPLSSQASAPRRSPTSELIARLDSLAPTMLERFGIPGMAIGIVSKGEMAWTRGYGYADRAAGKPVTAQTVFNIGSISKTVASWGALRLVEQGKLSLDRPIDAYLTRWHLPPAEFSADGVTLARLLSHTAGLSLHGYPGWGPGMPLPTLEESLGGNTNGPGAVRLIMPPGTKWQYSGGGYTIAQLAMEEASGQTFDEYMRQHVTGPLGMTRSDYGWTPKVLTNAATPYDLLGNPIPAPSPNFPEGAAAGFQTTVEDLARFAAAGMTGPRGEAPGRGVLRPETVHRMYALVPPAADWGLGYRVMTDTASGITVVGHGGANAGWMAELRIAPALQEGIVVMTNSTNGSVARALVTCAWDQWLGITRSCPKPSIQTVLYAAYTSGGVEALMARYRQLHRDAQDQFTFGEPQLVSVASTLRSARKLADAVTVLQLNRELFPGYAPTYTALGDVYAAQGDTTRAVASYQESLRIDPKADAPRERLGRLRIRP